MDNEWIVEGRTWKVGNNVNTESITPSRWLHEGHDLLMEHIGEFLIPEFPREVKKGDAWVGGTNLGCSSSRNAPLFLKEKGIGAIVCNSASRIFYRNAISAGLPIFVVGEEAEKLRMGDHVRIDVLSGTIEDVTTGEKIQARPYPDFIMNILKAGGIGPYIMSRKDEYKFLK
ncbi:MAG: 3-isopropylmalate dehydratase small subunit [Deltaproteobacteria bacterium]|nr:3-isopropylmalate dehydratase small subunit [Deltaproteobacteria bacterium]MBW2129943.1 3-isopropylmalate dehydratase small subunit [Deltaproteobacteria bacterium]